MTAKRKHVAEYRPRDQLRELEEYARIEEQARRRLEKKGIVAPWDRKAHTYDDLQIYHEQLNTEVYRIRKEKQAANEVRNIPLSTNRQAKHTWSEIYYQ